jgi:uncharacterized protein YcaQ
MNLDRDQARRFLVERHLLAPPRSLPARASSVLAVVERLGSLQFDPLEAPGARNHELVLAARVAGFRKEWCTRWLYGPDRRLFEAWNKGLSLLPVAELAEHRGTWEAITQRWGGLLERHEGVTRRIVEAIGERGPLSVGAFGKGDVIDWWWGRTPVNRAVIDMLFLCGRLGIARRDGNARTYDLIERVLPARALDRRVQAEAAARHRLVSRVRGAGLLGKTGSAELLQGTGTAVELRARLEALVADGTLASVTIEGLRGTFYALPAEHAARRRAPAPPGAALLAPLDPLIWDRRFLRDLWDFDYLWEVYTPHARRRWGYLVLPILFGERLIGRIEPRATRAPGSLAIAGLWLEKGVDVDEPELADALAGALAAHAALVGATEITWARGLRRREGELARRARARIALAPASAKGVPGRARSG